MRAWYAKNSAKVSERRKLLRKSFSRSTLDEINATKRRHYNNTPKQQRSIINAKRYASKKAWYLKNRLRNAAIQKAWASVNQDKRRAACRRFSIKHPEQVKAKNMRRRVKIAATASNNKFVEHFIKRLRSLISVPCYYCGRKISGRKAHIDHIRAVSRGGNHAVENLCASCPSCNLSKNAKSLSEWVPVTQQPVLSL
jgi:5-methylcytosine-specific restriction endonuclease McrA